MNIAFKYRMRKLFFCCTTGWQYQAVLRIKENGKSPYCFLRNYELVNSGPPAAEGEELSKKVVTVMYDYALSVRV